MAQSQPEAKERTSWIFLKSSFANSVTAASNACFLLVVPAILVRSLSAPEFAVWALVLQIAGYTGLLTLGLQDAVGRYVAYYQERSDSGASREFIDTAFWLLCVAAVVGATIMLLLGVRLAQLFPQVPRSLVPFARDMLWAAGISLSAGLPFVAFSGVLIGLRRNDVVAGVLGSAKLALVVLLGLIAWKFHSLIWLMVCFVTVNALSYVALWASSRRFAAVSVRLRRPSRAALNVVWSYCGTMLVWQIVMLMITGLDVVIVGRVDFRALPYYSVCLVPITLLTGAMPAFFSPLMQVGAMFTARGREEELGPLLMRSTRLATVVLATSAAALLLFQHELFSVWLGPDYAVQTRSILFLVVLGHAFRQIAFPYSVLLLATNRQGEVLLGPVAEGVANILTAVIAGSIFGVLGVASAVVVGSVVSQLMNYYHNLPRTHGKSFDRRRLVSKSVVLPILCFAPLLLLVPAAALDLQEYLYVGVRLVLLLTSCALVWRYAIDAEEKQMAASALRHGMSRLSAGSRHLRY